MNAIFARPGSTGSALDTAVPLGYAREPLQPHGTVQGNLDPVLLIVGGAALEEAVRRLRRSLGRGTLHLQSRPRRAAGNTAGERRRRSPASWPNRWMPDVARIAVVLMNLGGPDRLEAVQPFLFNLFSDPAILRLPALVRLPLARIIAWRRSPGSAGDLSQARRRIAAARQHRGAGKSARSSSWGRSTGVLSRCAIGTRPASRPRARSPIGRRTRSFACRSIRNSRRRRRLRRSPLGAPRQHAMGLTCPTRVVCCYPSDPGLCRSGGRADPAGARLRLPVTRSRLVCCSPHTACRKGSCRLATPTPDQVESNRRGRDRRARTDRA